MLNLMYITNEENIAAIAENSGVNWIFIDLEINGKHERQGHLNTVISNHCIEDVKKIKGVLTKSKLLVRVNPIFQGSNEEINKVIAGGADIVMLPFFKTKEEVESFVEIVDGRAKTCLLLETPESVENIDSILSVKGIDFIHIGLNDLHLGYKMKFMFEPLANGTVEFLCNKIRDRRILYGFGGIAQIGQGQLLAEAIIAEHYRLGSTMVILSREFCNINQINNLDTVMELFLTGIQQIRNLENQLILKSKEYYMLNKDSVCKRVAEIVSSTK